MMTSRRTLRRRIACALIAGPATLAMVPPVDAALPTTHWARVPDGCPVPAADVQVACGRFGTFAFDITGAVPVCAPDGATEAVKTYGAPKGYEALPIEEPPVEYPGEWTLPTGGVPRHGPSTSPLGSTAPWSAIVDWDTWHGRSIAWIMQDMAPGTRLLFLDLEDTALVGEGVSDAHVLTQLCRLESMVHAGGSPPEVVNLSFGRYATPAESRSGATCNRNRLSCWITQVVEGLVDEGSVVAAAAGNHRSLLFPASIGATVAVGALDLAAFEATETVQPAWESPVEGDAWSMADNVCLRGGWFAPSGTSFATGIFTGWLLAALDDLPGFDARHVDTWQPMWLDDTCLVLAADGVPLHDCKTHISRFMDLVFSPSSPTSPCFRPPGEDRKTVVVPTPISSPAPRFESFDRWVATTHNPTPESDFCIPCMGGGSGGGGSQAQPQPTDRGAPSHAAAVDDHLVLDVSATPATHGYLDTLFLRDRSSFYRLAIGNEALLALGLGQVDQLIVENGRLLLDELEQASLIAVIRTRTDMRCDDVADGTYSGPGRCYWSTTPIYLGDGPVGD